MRTARIGDIRKLCISIACGGRRATAEIPTLVSLLLDSDAEMRETSAFALRFQCRNDPAAAMQVFYLNTGAILNSDPAAELASELVRLAGTRAIDRLIAELRAGVPLRRASACVLSRISPGIAKYNWAAVLEAAMLDDFVGSRMAQTIGEAYSGDCDDLQPLLGSSDSAVRCAGACALVRNGRIENGLPLLVAAMRQGAPEQRSMAAYGAAAIGRLAASAAEAAERLLSDDAPESRAAALVLMTSIALDGGDGDEIARTTDKALSALDDPAYEVRSQAARLLGAIGPPLALVGTEPLFRAAVERRGEGFFVSIPAVQALASMGPAAVPLLCDRLAHDGDERYRAAAATTLGEIASDTASDTLRRAMGDSDWLVRLRCAAALTTCGEPGTGCDYLRSAAADPDWKVRTQTAFILGRLPGQDEFSATTLATALDDSHPEVRRQAVESFGRRGNAVKAIVPRLWGMLEDDDLAVRRQLLRSLQDLLLSDDRERLKVVTSY